MSHDLEQHINNIWDNLDKALQDPTEKNNLLHAVKSIIEMLDNGSIRVSEKIEDNWVVHEWIKRAILISFKLIPNSLYKSGCSIYYDKFPSKFSSWSEQDFVTAKIRALPGSFVRHGAFIGQNSIIMPSFVNFGAYIDSGTMVDSGATIGSCAQIGKNCHISSNAVIGGVLEPINARPVIIEDNCFIGLHSGIAEGAVIEEGSVISMGVHIGASTKILDRETGEITYGRIPANSVVVPGSIPTTNGVNLYAAVIVKRVSSETRQKTSINDLLRNYQ